jgi:vacuolar-type H+-ATPase subunit E/Vma4
MTLDSLVEEIRRRGAEEARTIADEESAALGAIARDRDARIEEMRRASAAAGAAEIARERAQRLAAAKLESRKKLYEARERRLVRSVAATRELLADFTRTPAYAGVLARMLDAAADELGKTVKVMGRAEDASLLAKVAGKSFDPTPVPIVGGLVARTPSGDRQLNLSFDELLRLREDRVRELLA